jgi:hypothetical protein
VTDKIKLTITQNKKVAPRSNMRFCVDDPKAPGSPFVGYGSSIAEALGNWVIGNAERHNLRFEPTDDVQKHVDHSNATKIGLHR